MSTNFYLITRRDVCSECGAGRSEGGGQGDHIGKRVALAESGGTRFIWAIPPGVIWYAAAKGAIATDECGAGRMPPWDVTRTNPANYAC